MRVWRGRLKVKLLSIMLRIVSKKFKIANGLIKEIKCYHIHFYSSFNSPIEKSYDCYTIRRDLCMVWRVHLKSKAAKYDSESRVKENICGLWTYKRHQGLSYSSLVVF
jgi:hypothetical protein